MCSQEIGSFVALLTFGQAALAFALVERESKAGAKAVPSSKFGTAAKYASTLRCPDVKIPPPLLCASAPV